jgi:uncharacterized protein YgbK (DUF1537 family)
LTNWLAELGEGVVVSDAETDEDLGALVRAARGAHIRLLCGSAGLSSALQRSMASSSAIDSAPSMPPPPSADGAGVLVVAASRHPQTLRQVATLEDAGVAVTTPELAWFANPAQGEDDVLGEWREGLAAGSVALTCRNLPDLTGSEAMLLSRLAQATRVLVERAHPLGLVLTGGDAAIAVSQALGAHALELRGEVRVGIPWGVLIGGECAGLPVVTKAGGFGDDDALVAAVQFLTQGRSMREGVQ